MTTRPFDQNNANRASDPFHAPTAFPWPPLLYLGALAIAVLLQIFLPAPWFGRPLSDILFAVGCLLIVGVAALYISAISALRRAKTTIRPHAGATHLVTSGPFAISRNPLYLGNSVLMFAVGFVVGNAWFLLLGVLASIATNKLAVEPEERHLEARFGKAYRDYKKKVRRWI